MSTTFLSAYWRKLIMANYVVDAQLLRPWLPAGTEPDTWNGRHYLSLVGFLFDDTRLKGWKIPFHTRFEEVNLRMYVRCRMQGEWRRGVVFIRELVPMPAIAFVANAVYREHYRSLPMRHSWSVSGAAQEVSYAWKLNGNWHRMLVKADTESKALVAGSEEAFIAEHYFGFTKVKATRTWGYEVQHPSWRVHHVQQFDLDADLEALYGHTLAQALNKKPESVFLAEGSEVNVRQKFRLR